MSIPMVMSEASWVFLMPPNPLEAGPFGANQSSLLLFCSAWLFNTKEEVRIDVSGVCIEPAILPPTFSSKSVVVKLSHALQSSFQIILDLDV